MEKLLPELIQEILDHIDCDPEKTLPIDVRRYLSVESFRLPEPVPDRAQDVANFRLVCKRFAAIGVRHQFTRITTRFSKKGFRRLKNIAEQPHLAEHVKKFSYMIPFFYVEGRERIDELFREYREDLAGLDPSIYKSKAREQREIIHSGLDVSVLKTAMSAFTSLQHVQLLRLQDEADRHLIDCLHAHHDSAPRLVDLAWTPACLHATRTTGEALLSAESSFSRFSGPMMSPQSSLDPLNPRSSPLLQSLAARLTCLELHFDDWTNLDDKMHQLSGLFKTVFEAATGMQAVHVGFPSRAPLSLPLESIFHHVQWDKLRALGIQAWRLDADSILRLARRHRHSLRGLRLRDVLLTGDSRWKDVLACLREEMTLLDWVSLRRIGYAATFDEVDAQAMEVPDSYSSTEGESGDESLTPFSSGTEDSDHGDDDDAGAPSSSSGGGHGGLAAGNSGLGVVGADVLDTDDVDNDDDHDDIDDNSSFASDDSDPQLTSDHGPDAHALALSPDAPAPDTPGSAPWCRCGRRRSSSAGAGASGSAGGTATATAGPAAPASRVDKEDLGDNGRVVSPEQRRMWERWVVGGCMEHGLHRG